MFNYLRHGWTTQSTPQRMRAQVLDGAIDAAAYLFQAGVTPEAVAKVALRLRALSSILSAPHRSQSQRKGPQAPLEGEEIQALHVQAEQAAEKHLALQSFICDCLDTVKTVKDLQSLFLHLVHIGRMMQLVRLAKLKQAKIGPDTFVPPQGVSAKGRRPAMRARI